MSVEINEELKASIRRLEAENKMLKDQLHRHTCGEAIEGDYVCESSLSIQIKLDETVKALRHFVDFVLAGGTLNEEELGKVYAVLPGDNK